MRFRNLAGVSATEATKHVLLELEACGIPVDLYRPNPLSREVRSDVTGHLRMAGGITVRFDRAWIYYVVQVESPAEGMPLDRATLLHENAPGHGYNDGISIRAEGHAAGLAPEGPVSLWHVDTVEGLAVTAAHLRLWYQAASKGETA